QAGVGHNAVQEENERGAARIRIIERTHEDGAREAGVRQCRLQAVPQSRCHAKDRIDFHAALLSTFASISVGGMPSLAYSARAASAMCVRLICWSAAAAMKAARNVICRMWPPVKSIFRASWRKAASSRT